jgi:hypothetical protein
MSGGSLGYFCYNLADHENDLGDKELNELVHDLAQLFHDREWYLSADTGVGDWNESRDKFKQKWFTEIGRRERIENYLAALSEEIRQSFGMSRKYCKFCSHWTQEKKESKYGRCENSKNCLLHRSDGCNMWEQKAEKEGGDNT